MASDSLRQIGKYIKKSGKDSERSLKRAYPIQPRLERVRDVFDSTTEFEMQFDTTYNDKRVLLDLFFTLPPPSRGCKAGCIISNCQLYTFESGGNHAVTLDHPYLPTTISVFVNGNRLSDTQVNEISPTAGEVFYQGTDGPDTIAICYVYSTCGNDSGFIECPALDSILGLQLLFSDRMDREPNVATYGGYGYWYIKNTVIDNLYIPVKLYHNGGMSPLQTPSQNDVVGTTHLDYVFQTQHAAGALFETLLAMDLSSLGTFGTFTYTVGGDSLVIQGPGLVTISSAYEHQVTSSGSVSYADISTSIQSPIAVTQRVYIRYLYDGHSYKVRIWPQNEPEPEYWLEHEPKLPATIPAGSERMELAEYDHMGGQLSGNGYLMAIQHWGGNFGDSEALWKYGGETGASWSRYVNYSPADAHVDPPDGIYFGIGPDTVKTLTEFGTDPAGDNVFLWSSVARTTVDTAPTFNLNYTWMQFFPDRGFYYGLNQTVVSFSSDVGKGSILKITGEVQWLIDGSVQVLPDDLAIAIMAFNYGDGPPSTGADYLAGSSIDVVHAAWNTWVPFSVEIPVVNGHFQWGARITNEPVALGLSMLNNTGTVFLPRTASIGLRFRRFKSEAVMNPIGGALPFCPDGTLASRCTSLVDNFAGPLASGYNCDGFTTEFSATSGQTWLATLGDGAAMALDLNSGLKFSWKANGLTDDGSDGRCARTNGRFWNDRSQTFIGGDLSVDSPAFCGNSAIFMQVRYSGLGPNYTLTSVAPGWESDIGRTFSPIGQLSIGSWLTLGVSHDSFDNIIQRAGTSTIPNFMNPDELYSIYIESTDVARIKIWPSSSPEPSTWLSAAPIDVTDMFMGFSANYSTYVNDNFTWEVFGVTITPIEPRVAGPSV